MRSDELDRLRQAAEGLLYPSETDAPLEVFCWESAGTAQEQVLQHNAKPPVEIWTLEQFFGELEGAEEAERFRQLRAVVERCLMDAKVLRAGARRIDVYLIGRLSSGAWAGLRTVSVET